VVDAQSPTGRDVVERMLETIGDVPGIVFADAEFRLRVMKPVGDPPDCVFKGRAQVVSGQPTVRITDRTGGPICWAVGRYVIGRPFEGSERLERFLSRFDFEVLGRKLVGNDRYYLVQGKAKDPANQPRALIGWIDYDEGLLMEETVEYSWGRIDSTQGYARVDNVWVLTRQYLYTPRFETSLEIVYRNVRFGPH
jgi:hypothetical protein